MAFNCINTTPSHASLALHNSRQVASSLARPQIQEDKHTRRKMQDADDPDEECCLPALPMRSLIKEVACLDSTVPSSIYSRPLTCHANLSPKELQINTSVLSTPLSKASSHACNNIMAVQSGGVQRKPRRCWSPELHQRFLRALNHLGGCQVATPKQIRELMNVEGLTNDEVKSHLQKFRLHMRRPNAGLPNSQGNSQQASPGRHLVVFGHIWVPPEYGDEHHQHATNANIDIISSDHEVPAANGTMELMQSFRRSGSMLSTSCIEHVNGSRQALGRYVNGGQCESGRVAQAGLLRLCEEVEECSDKELRLYERGNVYDQMQHHLDVGGNILERNIAANIAADAQGDAGCEAGDYLAGEALLNARKLEASAAQVIEQADQE